MYDNIRKKLNKYATGGKIPKYQTAPGQMPGTFDGQSDGNGHIWNASIGMWVLDPNNKLTLNRPDLTSGIGFDSSNTGVNVSTGNSNSTLGKTTTHINNDGSMVTTGTNTDIVTDNKKPNTESDKDKPIQMHGGTSLDSIMSNIGDTAKNWEDLKKNDLTGLAIGGIAAQVGTAAVNAVDQLTMGDKNFSALSQAVDSAVHGVSGALMSSGNPYMMAAAAGLEGANFLTKAGGQTVQGFDVDIDNAGYGTLGHMDSSSSRDFGAMIGLGGLNKGSMERKLAKRNEQARMALSAAEISEEQAYQSEARMNSIENTIMNNQIALAGGVDSSLLGA